MLQVACSVESLSGLRFFFFLIKLKRRKGRLKEVGNPGGGGVLVWDAKEEFFLLFVSSGV